VAPVAPTGLSLEEFLRTADGSAGRVAEGERIEVVDRTGVVHDMGPLCASLEPGPLPAMTLAELARRFRVVDPTFERDSRFDRLSGPEGP
jgi:hypothetical protein